MNGEDRNAKSNNWSGLSVMLLAMSAAAVMAKPSAARTVAGGATFDRTATTTISASLSANERTQSGNSTLHAVVDETQFQYGFGRTLPV